MTRREWGVVASVPRMSERARTDIGVLARDMESIESTG